MATIVHGAPSQGKPKKLLEQVRDVMRFKHYSLRTERTYSDWIIRFICFHGNRHPSEMGTAEVGLFLTHLAREGKVSYKHVLNKPGLGVKSPLDQPARLE